MRFSTIVKYMFIVGLVVSQVFDIITTLMVKYKHPVFNEANPLYIMGLNIYGLFFLKVVVVSSIVYTLLRQYHKIEFVFVRYLYIYMLTLLFILGFGVVANNYMVYKVDSEYIVPIPDDQKIEHYKRAVVDMEAVRPEGGFGGFMFVLNMIQFSIWRCFENERKRYRDSQNQLG